MRYNILGSMLAGGQPVGPRQVRTVLGVLLSHANQPVTTHVLAGELWPGRAPDTSAAVLQGRVSSLRKLLCPDLPARSPEHVIRSRQGCYQLALGDDELDAAEFLRLAEAGERAATLGGFAEARRSLRGAVRLWRGPALQDAGGGSVLASYAAMLEQRRLAALEKLFEVDIALGEFGEAISGLTEHLSNDPTQENFAALLVEALQLAGRTAAAREVLEQTHTALESRGMPVGTRLRQAGDRLHREPPAPDTHTRPAQVPAQLVDFTGRAELLERIRTELGGRGPRLVTLTGPGGVGKSTLAVHAAHQLRRDFLDGQVVAELAAESSRPGEVLHRFLRAIGVPEEAIPHGFVERQQLWRSHTADARILVLLDDARDEAQVRALQPAGTGCGVLVTSRRRMLGLGGATTIPVEAFADEESAQLLANMIGAQRVAAEPEAARRLLALCAGLPLAVRIVGAKLAARPHEQIEELVGRIRTRQSRLSELRAGDLDVRATIELSYQECTEPARRALRLLGAVRLPAISRLAVASLLSAPAEFGGEIAESLVDAQLLRVQGRDAFGNLRYQLHDLIAEFAVEKLARTGDAAELDSGLTGLIDHYLAVPTAQRSADWWMLEADNVLAVARTALRRRWWERAERLGESFAEPARMCPGTAAARELTVVVMWAARQRGDPHAEAVALRRLGELHWNQVKVGSAVRYLTMAAGRFRDLGARGELARTLVVEADVLVETGQVDTARERLTEAITVAERIGDVRLHAEALDELAGLLADAGEFAAADDCFGTALRLARSAGDERTAIMVLKRRADVLRRLGRCDEATALLEESLLGARRTGDRHWEAHALRSLGEVQRFVGDTDAARHSLTRSLELFTQHGHRHAAAYSRRSLADLHAQLHEYERASEALEECREVFEALHDRRGQAYTLRSLGALGVRTHRWTQAERSLRAAQRIFDELSMRWFSQDVARALAQTRHWAQLADPPDKSSAVPGNL